MRKLEGKVGVIIGGATGMGLATARLFALEGALIYIMGRRDTAVRAIGKNVTSVL